MGIKQSYAMISINDLRELLNAKGLVDAVFEKIKENGFFCSSYHISIKDTELKALFPCQYEKTEGEIIERKNNK